MGSGKRKASVNILLWGKPIQPTIVLMQMVTVCCRCAVEHNTGRSSGISEVRNYTQKTLVCLITIIKENFKHSVLCFNHQHCKCSVVNVILRKWKCRSIQKLKSNWLRDFRLLYWHFKADRIFLGSSHLLLDFNYYCSRETGIESKIGELF